MTLEEAFRGVTRNAALSLRLRNEGLIQTGSKVGLLAWNYEKLDQIPYDNFFASDNITHYIKGRVYPRSVLQRKLDRLAKLG